MSYNLECENEMIIFGNCRKSQLGFFIASGADGFGYCQCETDEDYEDCDCFEEE